MTQRILTEIICFLFVLLFVYAALTKILDYEKFVAQVGQSPLLRHYAGFIGWFVPGVELLISSTFALPRLRLTGLYASFGLMVVFTAYIIAILNFSEYIPCTCGGVLEKLSWQEHLLFNIFFVLLALTGIFFQSNLNSNDETLSSTRKNIPLQQESGEAENLKKSKLMLFQKKKVMKKIRLFLPLLAFVFAVGASFAFNSKPPVTQALYYVTQSGAPTDPVGGPSANCLTSAQKCAQMFEVVNGQPTNPVAGTLINGTRIQ